MRQHSVSQLLLVEVRRVLVSVQLERVQKRQLLVVKLPEIFRGSGSNIDSVYGFKIRLVVEHPENGGHRYLGKHLVFVHDRRQGPVSAGKSPRNVKYIRPAPVARHAVVVTILTEVFSVFLRIPIKIVVQNFGQGEFALAPSIGRPPPAPVPPRGIDRKPGPLPEFVGVEWE